MTIMRHSRTAVLQNHGMPDRVAQYRKSRESCISREFHRENVTSKRGGKKKEREKMASLTIRINFFKSAIVAIGVKNGQ